MARVVTGYNYFGSFAVAICMGPVKELKSISNGDTIIWQGTVDISSADVDGKTTLTTELGVLDFYWGTSNQVVNALLASVELDTGSGLAPVPTPAYLNVCYAVCHDFAFGQQINPPTLLFDLRTETAGLDISAHSIDDDAILPEVLHDYATNRLYGMGADESQIDQESLALAAETLIDEDIAASPTLDENEPVLETISRMLSHVDGVVFFRDGKLRFKLERPQDPSTATVLNESDFLEEPSIRNQQWDETWNITRLTWRDRNNKWEEAVESYSDPAHAAMTGHAVAEQFNFPWFTRRGPAAATAKRLGIKGGIPATFMSLVLKPRRHSLAPGDLLKVNYAKFGLVNRLMRVTEVRRGGPGEPRVSVECSDERTRDTANDYVAPDVFAPNAYPEDEVQPTTPRILWLPPGKLNDSGDGVLVVGNRPNPTITAAGIYFTWDEASPGYGGIKTEETFPIKGTIVSWHRIGTGPSWLFRVEMDTTDDLQRIESLVATQAFAVEAAVGQRIVKTVGTPQNQHQMMPIWLQYAAGGRFELIGGRVIDIQMLAGQLGTPDVELETLADPAIAPTQHIYFGLATNFWTLSESWSSNLRFQRAGGNPVATTGTVDTEQKRFFKVIVANHNRVEAISEVTGIWYDRNDTTMCPDGTLSRDWGERALTTYEAFDNAASATPDELLDIDEAFGAILAGTLTAEQTLLAEHIDEVLGSMLTNSHLYYNTP